MGHLHVEDGVVHRLALGQLEVERLGRVDRLQEVGEARRIGADLVDDVAQLDDVAGALRQLDLFAVAHELDQLRDRHVEGCGVVTEGLQRMAGLEREVRWANWAGDVFDGESRTHVTVYRSPTASSGL